MDRRKERELDTQHFYNQNFIPNNFHNRGNKTPYALPTTRAGFSAMCPSKMGNLVEKHNMKTYADLNAQCIEKRVDPIALYHLLHSLASNQEMFLDAAWLWI